MTDPDRRTVLRGLGVLGAATLAGCSGDPPGASGPADGAEDTENREEGTDDEGDGADGDGDASGSPAFDLQEIDAPDWVPRGDGFTVDAVVENEGDGAGTYEDTLVDLDAETEIADVELSVPAGERARWTSPQLTRDRIPRSGDVEFSTADSDRSASVEVVEPLSLGEQYVYDDDVSVSIDAFVLRDDYEYAVGGERAVQSAGDGLAHLFVYLTPDLPESADRSLPDPEGIAVEIDGERVEPTSPAFFPADEPLEIGGRQRYSRIDPDAVASGLAAYDPAVIEETARLPPDERTLGDRDPIFPGESTWVLYTVPEDIEVWDLTVLLSR